MSTTADQDKMMLDPLLRPWRSHHRFAVLRLRKDVIGASRVPVRRAGELVFATQWNGQRPFAQGWLLSEIGFAVVMNEPDVDVVERP